MRKVSQKSPSRAQSRLRIGVGKGVPIPAPVAPEFDMLLAPALVDQGNLPNIDLIAQEQTEWCWAACVEMVLRHYNQPDNGQAALVGAKFERNCQVDPSNPTTCNRPCPVDDIASVYARVNIAANKIEDVVTEDILQQEIAANRPVEVGFVFGGGVSGHVVLVVGWDRPSPNLLNVTVCDPLPATKHVAYSELVTGYGVGSWQYTWTGIQ